MSNNGKKKTIKIIGWIVITIALLVLIVNLTSYIGWKVKSNKYICLNNSFVAQHLFNETGG